MEGEALDTKLTGTTRMHNYQKNTRLFENAQNVYSTSD